MSASLNSKVLFIEDHLIFSRFSDTIGKVQENTEFYWRYQRYTFVREYFERVPFGYPPLTFFSHIILLLNFMRKQICGKYCENQVNPKQYEPDTNSFTPIFSRFSLHVIQYGAFISVIV